MHKPSHTMRTPRDRDFRFPAEWELHRATWLSYPYQEASFPGRLDKVWPVFAEFVALISKSEKVCVNVPDSKHRDKARDEFRKAGANLSRVSFFLHPTDDVWCRDHGGIFLKNVASEKIILDWKFNAWGEKYPHENDRQIAQLVAEVLDIECITPGIVLEGGAIEHNGYGTILTTEACLLNPNRNATLSREEMERYLRDFLSVDQILWLGEGIAGDDTDGHVDDLTRFVHPTTIITVLEDKPTDENYAPLRENLERLHSFRLPNGRPLKIVTVPMPTPVFDDEGQRLPASYANFYITNQYVIVPTFGCRQDAMALQTIQRQFPDREIVGLDSRDLITGFGSFHCLTQQEPA